MIARSCACLVAVALCACGGGSGSTSVTALPLATVTDLGLVATEIEGGANLWATSVREDVQAADLNGDGDRDDALVYVYDSATKRLHATGLEGQVNAVVANERFLAFLAHEDGTDLDGDGDTLDEVLHVYEPVSERVVNLGVAVIDTGLYQKALALEDGLLAAPVDEAAQGADLNGDGDTRDDVVEVFRPETGEHWNVGVASGAVEIHSGLVVVSLYEEGQGADFNADGDLHDLVTAFFDPDTGLVQNTALERVFGVLDGGGVFGMLVAETNGDLNGDGDPFDAVDFTYDPLTEVAKPAPFFGGLVDGRGGRFALLVKETTLDHNGDGDLEDLVAFLYEPLTDVLVPTGLAVAELLPGHGWVRFVGDELAFFCDEAAQGVDLNGDGDRADRVLQLVDPAGHVRNTRIAGQSYDLHDDQILLVREESADHRDWNGDGDRRDSVMVELDPATSRVTVVGDEPLMAFQPRGARALVLAFEDTEHLDLNGDGRMDDLVYVVRDIASGGLLNTRLSACDVLNARATPQGSFLFSAWELQEGRDLNGDGDLDDHLLHVVE